MFESIWEEDLRRDGVDPPWIAPEVRFPGTRLREARARLDAGERLVDQLAGEAGARPEPRASTRVRASRTSWQGSPVRAWSGSARARARWAAGPRSPSSPTGSPTTS